MIKILSEGVLFRNPYPDLRALHAYFPFIVELSEHEFLCTYRRGSAFASVDGLIGLLRSTDGGRTWVEEGVVWDGSKDERRYCYRTGPVTKLADGTLIIASCRFDRSDPDKPLYNPATEGYLPVDAALFRSRDGGRHWSAPQSVSLPGGEVGNPIGPIIELSDGCLMLTFETWKAYDDPRPPHQRTVAIFSHDQGKTWGEVTPVADGSSEGLVYWDSSITKLENDRLFALFWTRNLRSDQDLPIHYATSDDGGRTWSSPRSTGIEGHTTCPVYLGEERVLTVYTLRNVERPGIYAVLSEDEGKTWQFKDQVIIWDAAGQANVGLARSRRCLADMATYAFGKPQAIMTSNGDVLASFWCTQACVTHIRWCKLRVE
jgi:hypothetical protein